MNFNRDSSLNTLCLSKSRCNSCKSEVFITLLHEKVFHKRRNLYKFTVSLWDILFYDKRLDNYS